MRIVGAALHLRLSALTRSMYSVSDRFYSDLGKSVSCPRGPTLGADPFGLHCNGTISFFASLSASSPSGNSGLPRIQWRCTRYVAAAE